MALTKSLFFLVASILCFAVALLLALGVFNGSNETTWVIGGLLAFALAHLP